MIDTTTHRVGLRFPRSQARTLRYLAQRAHARELGPEVTSLFDQAAGAAATGEPLIVVCSDPAEAIAMADGFTMYGVTRPAVEQLSDPGG